VRKRYQPIDVFARCRVLLMDLRKPWAREAVRESHQCRPQPAVHQSYLARDEPARQQITRFSYLRQYCEDSMARRVRPPAAANRLTEYDFDQARRPTLRGHEYGAVLLDKSKGEGGIQHGSECSEPRSQL